MTQLFEMPDVTAELQKFSVQDAAIAEMAEQYLPLKINGIEDNAGYERVHKAKMIVVKARTATEKVRKTLKADALEFGRKVDAEAKRITSLLEPIETHLASEEKRIDDEVERIKNAAKLRAEAEEKARKDAEEAARVAAIAVENARLAAERAELDKQRAAMEADRKRQEAEAKARQEAEQAELRRQRELLEAERRKQEEAHAVEAARLKAESDRIDAANRAAEMEAARLRKVGQDRIDADRRFAEAQARVKAKIEADKAEEIRRKQEAEAARLLAEKLRPDQEKLLAVASIIAGIDVPEVESQEARTIAAIITEIINTAAADVRRYAMSLSPSADDDDDLPFA